MRRVSEIARAAESPSKRCHELSLTIRNFVFAPKSIGSEYVPSLAVTASTTLFQLVGLVWVVGLVCVVVLVVVDVVLLVD